MPWDLKLRLFYPLTLATRALDGSREASTAVAGPVGSLNTNGQSAMFIGPSHNYYLSMLGNAPLMAFVPVGDLASARSFYGETLGLQVMEENPFAVVLDAGGTMLRLTQVDGLQPQAFTIAGWEVPDIGLAVDALAGRGITFTRYDGMEQDDKCVWTTPGGDRVAWFKDPDGNTLSLTSFSSQWRSARIA